MSKSSNKQKVECLLPWLEWFKKHHGYKRTPKSQKQQN